MILFSVVVAAVANVVFMLCYAVDPIATPWSISQLIKASWPFDSSPGFLLYRSYLQGCNNPMNEVKKDK